MRRIGGLSRRGKLLVGVVAVAGALGVATAVQASIPDANGVAHACYNTSLAHGSPTGALRVIDTSLPNGNCASWEAPIDLATPAFVRANQFLRLSSQWAEGEISTSSSHNLYTNTVAVPNNMHTLYVTVTGTSDDHNSAVQHLICHVDANGCDPNADIRIINVGPNDWHDNSVVARWCLPVTPGTSPTTNHTVTIDQSSSNGGNVYIEKIVITVDADTNANACTNFGGDDGASVHGH